MKLKDFQKDIFLSYNLTYGNMTSMGSYAVHPHPPKLKRVRKKLVKESRKQQLFKILRSLL